MPNALRKHKVSAPCLASRPPCSRAGEGSTQGMHSRPGTGAAALQCGDRVPSGYWGGLRELCLVWHAPVSPASVMTPIHTMVRISTERLSAPAIFFVCHFRAGLWAARSSSGVHFHPGSSLQDPDYSQRISDSTAHLVPGQRAAATPASSLPPTLPEPQPPAVTLPLPHMGNKTSSYWE